MGQKTFPEPSVTELICPLPRVWRALRRAIRTWLGRVHHHYISRGFRILDVPISQHTRLRGVTARYVPRPLSRTVWQQFVGITLLGIVVEATFKATLEAGKHAP